MNKTLLFFILVVSFYGCSSYHHSSTTNYKLISKKHFKTLDLTGRKEVDVSATLNKHPFPEELETLILDSLSLKTFPTNIALFKNLKHISLVSNPNLNWSQTFDVLKELPIEFLNLKNNQIRVLPQNTKKLQSLTELNLSYNNLSAPQNYRLLSQLYNLNELWLDHNNLHKVPKAIGELYQISRLYLGHSKLEDLPLEFICLENLRVLHLEHNRFKQFPEVFLNKSSLLLVHLNNNSISSIPPSFEDKKISIKGLILDDNPISIEEQKKIKKEFSNFFLLSFDQKK